MILSVTFLVIAAVLAMWGTGYWWLTSEHQAPRRAARLPAGAARARWQAIVRACRRAGTTWGRNVRARLPQWPAWLLNWAWNRQATPYIPHTPGPGEENPTTRVAVSLAPVQPTRLATGAERQWWLTPAEQDPPLYSWKTGEFAAYVEAGEQ